MLCSGALPHAHVPTHNNHREACAPISFLMLSSMGCTTAKLAHLVACGSHLQLPPY